MLLPSDEKIIQKPQLLNHFLIIIWFDVLALIIMILGVIFLLWPVLKRRTIGAQDTAGKLLTDGIYSFCRHPIYLGIVLISLGFSLGGINVDGLLVFPLVLLLNYVQAKIEEIYDVGRRFKEEYSRYKRNTRLFGPIWFWSFLFISLIFPLVITSII